MARIQIALNVDDLDAAVDFYTKLLAVPPAKHRPGYANFVVEDPPFKLSLLTEYGRPGTVDHIGFEVADRDAVTTARDRLVEDGLAVVAELDMVCCYSMQHKAWVDDPDGARWELYTVLEHTDEAAGTGYGGADVSRTRAKAASGVRARSRRARQFGRRLRRRARRALVKTTDRH